jgi:VanZ family protein
MPRKRAALFALVYAAGVLYLSLYPWIFAPYPHAGELFWAELTDRRLILDTVLNVLFYFPLGSAVMIALDGTSFGLLAATAVGFGLSFVVESAQRYIPYRMGTYNDLLSNTAGAVAGALTAILWKSVGQSFRQRRWTKAVFSDGAILTILWLLWNAFQLLPAINRVSPRGVNVWMDTGTAFLGLLVVYFALRPHPFAAVVLALAPLVAFPFYPLPLVVRLAATACALLTYFARPKDSRYIGAACLLWLAFEELYPFRFAASPQVFWWLPFETLFSARPQTYYPVLFGKLFFYSAVIRAARFQVANARSALLLPAGVLVLGEFLQLYIPGRTPESTDFVLLALGWFLLWLASPGNWLSTDGEAAPGLRNEVCSTQE